MMDRAAVLHQLLQDPARVHALPRDEAIALLTQLATLQVALLRIACGPVEGPRHEMERLPAEEMLEAGEAAAMLGVSVRWLYRNAKRLPFTRPIAPKIVRFSRQGIQRWLATRKPLNNPRT